jgi:hypothetical protein
MMDFMEVNIMKNGKSRKYSQRQFKSEVRIFALKRPREVSDSLKPYGDDEYQ